MKYLFLAVIILLSGGVVLLQKQIDGSSYPFGRDLHAVQVRDAGILDYSEMREIDVQNYMGYRVGNTYRFILLVVGSGVGLAGALGWIAIRRAERLQESSKKSTNCAS